MISHQHAELRVATPTNEPYEWRHPGDRFNGKIMPNRGWRDMDCWLRADLHSQAASLGAQRFKTVSLLAEVDKLLTRASNGELSQTFPDDVAPSSPKDSGRTALIPDTTDATRFAHRDDWDLAAKERKRGDDANS
ncbi:hypothetical protein V3M78_06770 [Trueperella pyogenes]|uniref:hypothetical protein n=1 Tax=Trueperella pyogenes TaxID=1661 RepID=UPI00345CC914